MLNAKTGEWGWQILDKSPTILPNFWCQSGSLEVFLEYVRLIKKLSANSVTFNSPPPAPLFAHQLGSAWSKCDASHHWSEGGEGDTGSVRLLESKIANCHQSWQGGDEKEGPGLSRVAIPLLSFRVFDQGLPTKQFVEKAAPKKRLQRRQQCPNLGHFALWIGRWLAVAEAPAMQLGFPQQLPATIIHHHYSGYEILL